MHLRRVMDSLVAGKRDRCVHMARHVLEEFRADTSAVTHPWVIDDMLTAITEAPWDLPDDELVCRIQVARDYLASLTG